MTEPTPDPGTKVCPQCAEEVKAAALICRFCRFEFEPLPDATEPSATRVPQTTQPAVTSSETPDSSVPRSRADLAVELAQATEQWTLPRLLGKFDATRAGLGEIGDTEAVMREHGYEPASPTHDEQGRTNITYTRQPASAGAGGQPAAATPRQGTKAPWFIVLGILVVVVIVIGAVVASGTLAAKHTLTGTLAIPPADASQNLDWLVHVTDSTGAVRPGAPCTTKGAYSDIDVGTGVMVRDDTDKVVGSASLTSGTLAFDKAPECIFRFTVDGVSDAKFYTIEVGGRGKLAFSADSLKATNWSAALSLGGAQ
jgi:Uncharacterised protein family UPF0547